MIDSHTDKSKSLIQALALRVGSNDFLKIAEHVSEADKPQYIADYADSENKLYPCHTKEATLVNFAYFIDQASAYSKDKAERIGQKFQEKIAFWGLEDAVEDLIESVTKAEPVKYAMESQKLFPYTDAKTLAKSAESFYNSRFKFPYQMRKEASAKFLKVADKLGAKLSNDVVRYFTKAAGWAAADLEGMVAVVRRRVHDTAHKKTASDLEAIATVLPHFEENTASLYDTEKVAAFIEAVEAYDRSTGLAKEYRFIGTPEERIYSDTDLAKIATELKNTVKLTNGTEVEVTQDLVNKIAAADPSLGKDIGGSVEKAVDILPTLPRPDADYITETCL